MLRTLAALSLAAALAACSPIRPEAAQLSAELGLRIAAGRAAHVALVHQYFEQRRLRVDSFIEQEYLPWKIKAVFGGKQAGNAFREHCKTRSADCDELLLGLSLRVTQPAERQRIEINRRLAALEFEVLQALDQHYGQTSAANARLTVLLDQAARANIDTGALLRGFSTTGLGLPVVDGVSVPGLLDAAEQVTDLATQSPARFEAALKPVDALIRSALPQNRGVRNAH